MSKFIAVFVTIAAFTCAAAYAGQIEVDKCIKTCQKVPSPDELPRCPEVCEALFRAEQ